MFGKFCVQQSEKPVNGLDACKLQELLSYILLFRESPIRGKVWQLYSGVTVQPRNRRSTCARLYGRSNLF